MWLQGTRCDVLPPLQSRLEAERISQILYWRVLQYASGADAARTARPDGCYRCWPAHDRQLQRPRGCCQDCIVELRHEESTYRPSPVDTYFGHSYVVYASRRATNKHKLVQGGMK